MKIEKPKMGIYDRQYVHVVRTEKPTSVKPSVFRELEDPVAIALWLTDLVSLSPEAQAILKKLRKRKGEATLLNETTEWVELYNELKKIMKELNNDKDDGKSSSKKSSDILNLITLPVMQKPLAEIFPCEQTGRKLRPYSYVRDMLERMIVRYTHPSVKDKLIEELEVLGSKVIELVKRFGIRIIILGTKEVLSQIKIKGMSLVVKGEKTFDGRDVDSIRGRYDPSYRLIVIGEECIGRPHGSTAQHEFAHAYDHAFSEKQGRKFQLSVQLWNLFAPTRTSFISSYASTRPEEYFAESVEAFFDTRMKPILKKEDPQMYQFLEKLFKG